MHVNPPAGDLWVFGYGSLMWRPGFEFLERHAALLRGYRRRLCVLSHVHRGTPEQPGLVLGLDRGGACRGVAYRVCRSKREETIAYLRAREQVTNIYLEAVPNIRLDDGRRVRALTYTVDRSHHQYLGDGDHETLLRYVRQGRGQSGANPDYVIATHRQLADIGVTDPTLAWLAGRLG
jgi:cation transport protein ChaC